MLISLRPAVLYKTINSLAYKVQAYNNVQKRNCEKTLTKFRELFFKGLVEMEAKANLFYYYSLTICYKTSNTSHTEHSSILRMWRSVTATVGSYSLPLQDHKVLDGLILNMKAIYSLETSVTFTNQNGVAYRNTDPTTSNLVICTLQYFSETWNYHGSRYEENLRYDAK
jgi:hypothetical protein